MPLSVLSCRDRSDVCHATREGGAGAGESTGLELARALRYSSGRGGRPPMSSNSFVVAPSTSLQVEKDPRAFKLVPQLKRNLEAMLFKVKALIEAMGCLCEYHWLAG